MCLGQGVQPEKRRLRGDLLTLHRREQPGGGQGTGTGGEEIDISDI